MLLAAEDAPNGHTMLGNQPPAEPDSAFRSMYAEHRPALLRLATTLTAGDRGRAEDLVQETMLRAWTHRNDLDIHRSPRAWLATTTRHLAIDAHRARRARPHEVELDHRLPLITSQRADASIDETGVRAAVGALPWHQRRVLTEMYYRDRSAAETARILQIPVGTVKSRIFYGLRALRRTLAAQDAVASAHPRKSNPLGSCASARSSWR